MELRQGTDDALERLDELSHVVEALVFGADEPVHAERVAEVYAEIRGVSRPSVDEVETAVTVLNQAYEASGHSIRVFKWAEGFRMATIPEVAPFLKAFLDSRKSRKLSRSLLETLAVVAYRQPVTKPEVDFVRGVDSDYALRKLMELDMIDVVGRSDAVGRPLLYGTTTTFLEKFGLDRLDTLPNLREVEDLLSDPAFNHEKARLLLRESLFDVQPEDQKEESAMSPEGVTAAGLEPGEAVHESDTDGASSANGDGRNGAS
ncbi:MAG: SMC-Scp complex subunit ScpB [Rhodothermia bacterium]|nr:SMC-Scp complex subunit ScpB [Rhodothermia bacterium]